MKHLFTIILSITIGWDMLTPAPGYRIHYTAGGNQCVGYSASQRFTIQETISGRQYKVYVIATNSSGESPKSRIVTVTNK